jgi:hypothetical protein
LDFRAALGPIPVSRVDREAAEAAMANTREHRYAVSLTWNGNLGSGTSGYRDYSRSYEISADGKPAIQGSADPAFIIWGRRPKPSGRSQ